VLDIKQKVELLEEKLRSYFAYWLGVCNDNLEKQIINDKKNTYDKVILVIEGIDHFID
jgi:arabinogalactan endo-1,4-beta-galactosidase